MARLFMFDAYGTLFDVHAAVARAGAALGANREAASQAWRAKQLEYTWTLTLMDESAGVDFEILTARALDFVLEKFSAQDAALRRDLLDAYRRLDAFGDVAPALQALKDAGHRTAIFTNGTRAMVDDAIAASGIAPLLDLVITVEPTGRFKPHPDVYAHARCEAGNPDPREIVFVSSNRWDVAGAAAAGFTPVWVNRTGQGDEYPGLAPVTILTGLSEIGRI